MIIVVGKRGVGKSTYAEGMRTYSKEQIVEAQSIFHIPSHLVLQARRIIEIKDITDEVKGIKK